MNEMKNATEKINRRIDRAEERICKLEDRTFAIIQSKENKEKREEKKAYVIHRILERKKKIC